MQRIFAANNVSFYKIIVLCQSNSYHTENRSNDITFDNEKLMNTIQSLDANKARGYDGIAIRMQ